MGDRFRPCWTRDLTGSMETDTLMADLRRIGDGLVLWLINPYNDDSPYRQ